MFGLFRRTKSHDGPALALYSSAVTHARAPVFYEEYEVADTPDGRFDLIMLHVYFILRRLKGDDGTARDLAQAVFDTMFADMDQNLREMGAGDIGVSYRVKDMARAFYGRIAAYDEGLDASDRAVLGAALKRNLYRKMDPTDDTVAAMAGYVRRQADMVSSVPLEELRSGRVRFGEAAELLKVGNG